MMKDVLIQIFGVYEPVVYTLSDGTACAGADWSYIGGVAVFCICLYSMFRILGGLFKR